MLPERMIQLMSRYLSGESTPGEREEFQALLSKDPQAQYFFEIFSEYWSLAPDTTEDKIQEEIHFQQIIAIAENRTELPVMEEDLPSTHAPVFTLRRLSAIAAVLLVVSLSYIFMIHRQSSKTVVAPMALNEVVARPGARSYLLLPDGSKVWLNSESRIEYKGNFNDSIREVSLEGEAFFDVVKDKSRPFIVHTSDIDIRVLGTAFNVKSYPREKIIETTLIHGLIEVTNKREPTSPKVILRPHEKLVFSKEEQATIPDDAPARAVHMPYAVTALPRNINDTAVKETSWIYNKLVFDGESFREIAGKMERWYNVKIVFENEKVARIPIHVTFREETIEEALKALQLIEPFTYRMKDHEIEIL